MGDLHPLSAWAERRPERTASERAAIAGQHAAHLPAPSRTVRISNADLDAMKAAFIHRFDEDLPRTETLMAVAHIGYRMALRDRDATLAETNEDSAPAEGSQPGPRSGIAQTEAPK